MKDNKQFKTRLLQLAAFLYIKEDIKLVDFDKSNPRNIYFVFEPLGVAEKYEEEYLTYKASCNPKKLMDAFSILREKIFQIQRSNS